MSSSLIALVLAGLAILYVIATYNRLVAKKNMAEEAFSGMDVQLKRRYDLVPNLVETVKGYAKHEAGTLEEVTKMRAAAQGATNVDDRLKAEAGLSRAIGGLFAIAENYPDLKANQNFIGLQTELSDIEDQIQLARRYYNGTVRDLNTMIEMFPSNLVARIGNFQKKTFFELDNPAERQVQKVQF